MGDILGIHHMTAISGPAQENLDFYTGILGLRLVKLTVNFDDPSAYHLYYGDALGSPGTILTFFPYPTGHPARPGAGQATITHLSVPFGATLYWVDRFRKYEIDFDQPLVEDGRDHLAFRAPDGLQFELVAQRDYQESVPWGHSPVPAEMAIAGMTSISIVERTLGPTQRVLEEILGFQLQSQKDGCHRFVLGEGGIGKTIDVVVDTEGPTGRQGHGGVHHIAFRVADESNQMESRLELVKRGLNVSAVMDRDYFKSIYFREPGGVLFEIATDPPGFVIDESPESLGTSLRLPKQYESLRPQIEHSLPLLTLPRAKP